MVICAHSDDQVIGPGGTMAKYAKEGKQIYTIIFSYGEASHPWLREEITVDIRVKEAKAADKVVGGKSVEFIGLREGRFKEESKQKKVLHTLRQMIEQRKPHRIFTHAQDDPHPDHRAVHHIVMETVKQWRRGRPSRTSRTRRAVSPCPTIARAAVSLVEFWGRASGHLKLAVKGPH